MKIQAFAAIAVLGSVAMGVLSVPSGRAEGGVAAAAGRDSAAQEPMTFFVTSVGSGDGANLGGLEGADAHCETLAAAQEAGGRGWRAYLSTLGEDGSAAVHARDRIGSGPWHNHAGKLIASDIDELHSQAANVYKETSLTETGDMVNGRGDDPNMHDILTGSDLDGTAFVSRGYDNCGNWTANGEGMARVGHHDRLGGGQHPTSWNSAHFSRGCSQEDLQGTGGGGLFYCFAAGG